MKRSFEELVVLFERLGADDPAGWARSEATEDIPQLAAFLALRSLWRDAIDHWQTGDAENLPVVRRLLASGADRDDVVLLARGAAYEAVFATLYRLTGECGDDAVESPRWDLVETDGDGRPTGRLLRSLYEYLLTMDPSGREGRDLWE